MIPVLKTENSTDRSAAALRALLSWDDMAKTDTTPVIIKVSFEELQTEK